MASTKNLHLSMTPQGTNKSFLDWRLEQDGTENSNMQKIDKAWGDMKTMVDGAMAAVGHAYTAATVADMTDHDKSYVYVGSETGYTNGNWYYWNEDQSAWVSGGVYNATALQTDDTLTLAGEAADAKATGEAVGELKTQTNLVAEGFPERTVEYTSGNITSTGATNTNSSYLYTSSAIQIYDGDIIISDESYYFKAAVYSSATPAGVNFIAFATPDGYTTVTNHGRMYSAFVIPSEYSGKYLAICAFKEDGSDISGDASTLSNHIKVIRLGEGARKLGYERSLTSSDDMNTLTMSGIYRYTGSNAPANLPKTFASATGWAIVDTNANGSATVQILVSGRGIASRMSTSGTWTQYYDSVDNFNNQQLASKVVDILTKSVFQSELVRDLGLSVGGINPGSGAGDGTSTSKCQSQYLKIPAEDLIVEFDNPNYQWVSWSYSAQSINSATHANTIGIYPVCNTPLPVKYINGDNYLRIAFQRTDGAVLTTDLTDPTSDYSIITAGLHIRQRSDVSNSLNKVNMSSLKSKGSVTVVHNDDESVTASSSDSAAYQYFRVLSNVDTFLKPNVIYALRAKVTNITSIVCYLKFRGTVVGSNKLGNGLPSMTAPGEYAGFYRATGFEKHLDFFITGKTAEAGEVTVTDIMLAETDISLPYIPYGVSQDTLLPSIGAAADRKIWGIQNTLASGNQYAHVRWTPIADLPSQFSSISNKFDAGVEVMGVPYSSARGVDKLIGPQVSLYTFLTAVRNPRSVLFTRKLTYNNSRTYYGTVCSAMIGHCYHTRVNYTTAAMREWDQLEPIEYPDLQPGDLLLCSWHVQMVTSVYRDQYGRIMSVGWSEAGDPTVKETDPESWERFAQTHINNPDPADVFYPYRYKKINGVGYEQESGTIGYPDETLIEITVPDIMSEYGDKAVFREGESVVINVIDGIGYNSIQVSINGVVSQTISTIADFTLSDLTPGLYEITMTGPDDKATVTQFFVCDMTCSYNSSSHILTFGSDNAKAVAFYTYTNDSSTPSNKVVSFTDDDIENGYIDLSNYIDENYVNVKVAFEPNDYPEWGVATWYTKTPEEMGLWTTV